MTLRLNGTTGYVELEAPATAGSNTLVLPTGNGSADQALVTNGSGTLSFADRGRMVLETAKDWNWNGLSTNEVIDFENIPSWAKRITVMFNEVSTGGTSGVLVQLGTSSGVESTGYTSIAMYDGGVAATSAAGFIIDSTSVAASTRFGALQVALVASDAWVASGVITGLNTGSARVANSCSGGKTVSATLDRIRITTVAAGATNRFDAGTINIMYEG